MKLIQPNYESWRIFVFKIDGISPAAAFTHIAPPDHPKNVTFIISSPSAVGWVSWDKLKYLQYKSSRSCAQSSSSEYLHKHKTYVTVPAQNTKIYTIATNPHYVTLPIRFENNQTTSGWRTFRRVCFAQHLLNRSPPTLPVVSENLLQIFDFNHTLVLVLQF